MWGWPAPPVGRLAPRGHLSIPRCYVDFPSPPRMHLHRSLSPFDPRAHVASSGLYILAPALPPEASSHLRRHKP
jgi:hypothetical protein